MHVRLKISSKIYYTHYIRQGQIIYASFTPDKIYQYAIDDITESTTQRRQSTNPWTLIYSNEEI